MSKAIEKETIVGPLTTEQLRAEQAKRGVVVHDGSKDGKGYIEVAIAKDIVAMIHMPDPWDMTHGGEISRVSLQNGGDPISIIAANYLPDGTHRFYLMLKDDVKILNPIASQADLALELAYTLAARQHPNDPFLGNHPHIESEIIDHVFDSMTRLEIH